MLRRALAVSITSLLLVACSGAPSRDSAQRPSRSADARPVPPTLETIATIDVGEAPQTPVAGFGSIWVPNHHSNSVSRIDAATNEVVATIDVGKWTAGVSIGHGAVWVLNYDDRFMSKIDPASNRVQNIKTESGACGAPAPSRDWVWICQAPLKNGKGPTFLAQVDPSSGTIEKKIDLFGFPTAGNHHLWVAAPDQGNVLRLDPDTGEKTGSVEIQSADTITAGGGTVWVGTSGATAQVFRIDEETLETTIITPEGDDSFANLPETQLDGDKVWVFDTFETIFRVDTETNDAEAVATLTREPGAAPSGFEVAFGSFWITDFNEGVVRRFDMVP